MDPLSELESTLNAFAAAPLANPDQHAQCQFPARLQWLKTRLRGHPAFRADVKCPAFEKWTQSGNVSSLSVIYATGYLGNPASYYGHTLLKFNFGDEQGKAGLMDVSLNYGAILEGKDDDMLSYLIKCLIGGYEGGFSHIRFYFHEHNYGDIELRNLWEYRLDLPQESVRLVVAHAWEVLGKRYTYYFFRHNCAYRMTELLEIVDGLKLTPDIPPWVIPQSIVQILSGTQYRGKPLLAEVIHHPSRQSRFYEKYLSLSADESSALKNLVYKKYSFTDSQFQEMPLPSKQAILDTLLDYYQFIGVPLDRAPDEIKQSYAITLATRYQLPPGTPPVRALNSVAPQDGYPPGWVQVGWQHNELLGNTLSVRIRPAYYDVLDTDSSHVLNAALSMFDIQINAGERKTYIGKLDVINVESANPGLSGLPGDSGTAWKLRLGGEQLRLWCNNCFGARLQGDWGYGRQFVHGLFGAIYVGGALQDNQINQGVAYAKTSTALIFKPGNDFSMRLAYEQRLPIKSSQGSYDLLSAEARLALGKRSDLRLSYDWDGIRSFKVALGHYW